MTLKDGFLKLRRGNVMHSVGIIAEYNPFHNGHLYQLEKIRESTQADVLVVVMSGNFLQRGEPAIVDKWTRSEMALANGADLVVELPVSFSTQPADYFSRGAVQILNQLKVDEIAFGVESGTSEDYWEAGRWFVENEALINQNFQSSKTSTYAEQISQTVSSLNKDFPIDISSPNNQLGFAYTREIYRSHSDLLINVLERKDSAYHDSILSPKKSIASATAIRNALFNHQDVSSYLPASSVDLIKNKTLVRMQDYWPYIRYRLISSSISELKEIYQMEDGIESRLKEHALTVESFAEFMRIVKPKHLTYNRIQRINLYVLLNLRKKEVEKSMESIKGIHLLGFSTKGQKYLSSVKKQLTVPLLANINQGNSDLWNLDIRAGELYRLPNMKEIPFQDYKQNPIKILT